MRDLRELNVEMLTIGQYLALSNSHLQERRYVTRNVFKMFEAEAEADEIGFVQAAVGAMLRSSYHAGTHL
jgi:lipoic acid synthetase